MTIERLSLLDAPRLIADGALTDAKTIIGLLAARGTPAPATRSTARPPTRRCRWPPRSSSAGCAVERGRSASTLAAYRTDLRRYCAWLAGRGVDLPQVGEERHRPPTSPTCGSRAQGPGDGQAGAGGGPRPPPLPGPGGRRSPSTRPPTSAVPRVPRGLPKALTEAEVDAAPRRGRRATTRSPGATGPSSRSSTAPGCASPSWSGSRSADVDLDGALVRAFGKGRKERIVPLGPARPRGRWRPGSAPGGRPTLAPERWARRGDAEARVPQPAGRPADPPGGVGGGRASTATRWAWATGSAPRAAPLLRHPHARPRRRHPGRAGAARPRLDQHHADLHAGLAASGCGPSTETPTPGPLRPVTSGRARDGDGTLARC